MRSFPVFTSKEFRRRFYGTLETILGEGANGLSATNIVRLKAGWEADYKAWSERDLSQKRDVHWCEDRDQQPF